MTLDLHNDWYNNDHFVPYSNTIAFNWVVAPVVDANVPVQPVYFGVAFAFNSVCDCENRAFENAWTYARARVCGVCVRVCVHF